MDLAKPEPYRPDPGRSLTADEIEQLKKQYPWPRPERKLCRLESTNEKWRLGRK